MKQFYLLVALCFSVACFGQNKMIQEWKLTEIESYWFAAGVEQPLLFTVDSTENYLTNRVNYATEHGPFKRVFEGERENSYQLNSAGRTTVDGLTLLGSFTYERDEWKQHQYNLDPGYANASYTPYYVGAKQPVRSTEDVYSFSASVAKKNLSKQIDAALGFDYTIANLFGQTNPSGDVQKTFFKPELSLSFFDEVTLKVGYDKLKTEGSFLLKGANNNSLEVSNPLARFFYTGYGTRVVSSLSELNKNRDGLSFTLATNQQVLGGDFFATAEYNNQKTKFSQFESSSLVEEEVYGFYNSDQFIGRVLFSNQLSNKFEGFFNYQTSYFTSFDTNKGINGNSNLNLYEGNNYSHDLTLGVTKQEVNPSTLSLSVEYDDISRFEVSKIAFVSKRIQPELKFSKQINQTVVDWTVQPEVAFGYNTNLENEMVLTGSAGSNSPFFIQSIAIPETLYYGSDFLDAAASIDLIKSLKSVDLGFTVDYKLQHVVGDNQYQNNTSLEGNRSFINLGLTLFGK